MQIKPITTTRWKISYAKQERSTSLQFVTSMPQEHGLPRSPRSNTTIATGVETVGSLQQRMRPNTIHAVTAAGFALQVFLLVFASRMNGLSGATWVNLMPFGQDLLYLSGERSRLTCTSPQAVTCHRP